MNILKELARGVERGNAATVKSLVQSGITKRLTAADLLVRGLIPGMNRVGVRFRNNEVFVPEVLLSARAMKSGIELLRPFLAREHVAMRGRVVIGTVKGDLHDIGKTLVGYLLQGAGFEIIDLGIDVPKERFIEAARRSGARIIGMSSLLTTTMMYMKEVMAALRDSELYGRVRVIVGGAPVTQAFADEIGADGYSADAAGAVDLAGGFIRKSEEQIQ